MVERTIGTAQEDLQFIVLITSKKIEHITAEDVAKLNNILENLNSGNYDRLTLFTMVQSLEVAVPNYINDNILYLSAEFISKLSEPPYSNLFSSVLLVNA